jgi:DNA-directed RNA polymerase subunit RPC12/RpoP
MKSNKKKKPQYKYAYVCPHCGNDAPFKLRYDRDVKCFYCHNTYSKDERVRIILD